MVNGTLPRGNRVMGRVAWAAVAIALAVYAALFFRAGLAIAESTVIASGSSAATGDSGVLSVGGQTDLGIQFCGTGFSGAASIKQGASSASLVEVKAVTFTTNSDCTEYYKLKPSSFVQVTWTRSAGSVSIYLENRK